MKRTTDDHTIEEDHLRPTPCLHVYSGRYIQLPHLHRSFSLFFIALSILFDHVPLTPLSHLLLPHLLTCTYPIYLLALRHGYQHLYRSHLSSFHFLNSTALRHTTMMLLDVVQSNWLRNKVHSLSFVFTLVYFSIFCSTLSSPIYHQLTTLSPRLSEQSARCCTFLGPDNPSPIHKYKSCWRYSPFAFLCPLYLGSLL